MREQGCLYAVGAGPGNPEWMTLEADRILRQAPVIAFPKGQRDRPGRAETIIKRYLTLHKRVLGLVFPMVGDSQMLNAAWDEAALEVAACLSSGQDVAFVTEGDPAIYSTFYYLQDALERIIPDLHTEIVPGVSSVFAASAHLKSPLVLGTESLAVVPASQNMEAVTRALEHFDTVVILKAARVFDRLLDILADRNLLDRAVYVANVGRDDVSTVENVASLAGRPLPYMSLVIVHASKYPRRCGN